jgi:hypothetical protein
MPRTVRWTVEPLHLLLGLLRAAVLEQLDQDGPR